MKFYRKSELVEAELFDPEATIWPEGILAIDWDYKDRNRPCKWCDKSKCSKLGFYIK